MCTWKKEDPYTDAIHQGCLCCPPVERIAPMDMVIAVGFGIAQVTKDGNVIFSEDELGDDPRESDYPTLAKFEAMAAADPEHDWRCLLFAPLRGREYQRHDAGKWVLIASNQGFA